MSYLYWLFLLNFLLIVISNASLLNPGPAVMSSKFSVFFQNVQGLIPIGQLAEENPTLNTTKIHELNLHIHKSSPDIVIYNEIWLKPSILDNEILPTDKYKIFRLDRSISTHPLDPNSNRFRRNGGGVLIGIKHELDVVTNKIPIKCKAEILSIEISEDSGQKTILSTFYRVGTLGTDNHCMIDHYLKVIRRRRNVHQLILVGDLNMPCANWEDFTSQNPTEQLFLDTFGDLSMEQLVNEPTHRRGNVLDVVVADNPQAITELAVAHDRFVCGSDHLPITFNLRLRAKRNKPNKRTIYNFKRANWQDLNSDLLTTDWNTVLTSNSIESSWCKFKSRLNQLCEKHIPKIKISDEFKPPWYDSEVYSLERKRDRLHARYKRTGNLEHFAKFFACRREVKNLVDRKMEDSFEEENNRNHITKKFWSYVKSKSSFHRIPELVNYEGRMRSDREDQCNLFNEYFYNQFSEPSLYNIAIDFSSDVNFQIDFTPDRVQNLLSELNPNKAQGPDGIHGRVLKNCAHSLSLPLSTLFRFSYMVGEIPKE